jgi:16S rRNA G966 N2-methylase RsmD
VTIVEKDVKMYEFIKKTAVELKLENFKVLKMDVFKYIDHCAEKFDFIFAGPPYALGNIDDLPKLIFEKQLLNNKGWFVLEHTPRNDYKKFPFYTTERNYGTTVFSIFIQS